MPGERGGLGPEGAGPEARSAQEMGEVRKEAAVSAMADAVGRIAGLLPAEDNTTLLGSEKEPGGSELTEYGIRTPSIRTQGSGGRKYAFAVYDPEVSEVQAAVMVDVFDDESGRLWSNRYTIGQRDEKGRPGVWHERVDLSAPAGEPAGHQEWLDEAAIEAWVGRLAKVEAEVAAGKYRVEQPGQAAG